MNSSIDIDGRSARTAPVFVLYGSWRVVGVEVKRLKPLPLNPTIDRETKPCSHHLFSMPKRPPGVKNDYASSALQVVRKLPERALTLMCYFYLQDYDGFRSKVGDDICTRR